MKITLKKTSSFQRRLVAAYWSVMTIVDPPQPSYGWHPGRERILRDAARLYFQLAGFTPAGK